MNIEQKHNTGLIKDGVKWSGVVTMPEKDLNRIYKHPGMFIEGWDLEFKEGKLLLLPKDNLVVKVGVARSLDRLFQISGGTTVLPLNSLTQEVVRIGVDNGTTNPHADSLSSNNGGGTDTGSTGTPGQTLRTFNSAATRATLTNSATGTFNDTTTAGIGAVGFIMKRLFLSAHNATVTNAVASDTDGTLYSMTNVFTIDFVSIATWSASLTATITGAGT